MAPALDCISLAEWQEVHLPGRSLSPKDRELAAQLGGEAGRVDIDELRDGLRVCARSWVGVLRFESFEVRILPKLAGGNLGLVEMLAFTSGLNALRRNKGQRLLQTDPDGGLFDLLALLLAEACERLVNGGLLYDYITLEGDLPVLRGRLLVESQIRRRLGRVDRLECRYDEHSTDILENQLLSAALQVCAHRVTHPDVRRQVRRLSAIFAGLCQTETLDLRSARQSLVYHRLNQHYAEPHQLAWLILDALGIDDLFAAGPAHSFAFLLDMNLLFQQFIERYLEWTLRGSGLRLHAQRRDRSILYDLTRSQPYATVIPDLLLENPATGAHLPIDAKYKCYDDGKVSNADIYQAFLYAYAYQGGEERPRALLIYPSKQPSALRTDLQVRNSMQRVGAEVQVVGVNIGEALESIKSPEKASTFSNTIFQIVYCTGLAL